MTTPSLLKTIPTDTWIQASWEEFLTFADDPTLISGRFYYDEGKMRVEIAALGSAHSRDNSLVSKAIALFAALKGFRVIEFTNCSFQKTRIRECQPDIAFYIGTEFQFPPRNNSPVNLDLVAPPTLVIEIGASSIADDLGRKKLLYNRLGVQEYWVVNANAIAVSAFNLTQGVHSSLQQSQVLPGLDIALVQDILTRSQNEDDGEIIRSLINRFIR